ncbi:MAG: HD domain-containing phosphohydrolase [Bacillota bacterium]
MKFRPSAVEFVKRISLFFVFVFSSIQFIRTMDLSFVLLVVLISLYIILDHIAKLHNYNQSGESNAKSINEFRNEIKILEEELESLHEASKIITSTFDVKTIIEYTYNVLIKITGCEWYHISFVDKKTINSVLSYEYGEKRPDNIKEYDYTKHVQYMAEGKSGSFKGTDIEISSTDKGDTIVIPLDVSDDLIGVIYIASSREGAFSKVSLNFLESLAYYTAISVRNAEMFNNIYSQKQEIEALYEQAAASNEELNSYIKELDYTKEELNRKNDELTGFFDEIQFGYLQTVMSLANSIEAKDAYTRGHCQRVMEISCELARALGFTEDQIGDLRYAAILHDIGKIGISASILNKQGKLTDEEFEEIKKHPLIAYNILKDVEFLKNGLSAILQHHERYDGRGYPNGLKGEEICVFARIMCVADAFDAMTSDRPYRKGMEMEDAIKELERCKGTQFDPKIVDLLVGMADISRKSADLM